MITVMELLWVGSFHEIKEIVEVIKKTWKQE